MSPSTLSSDAGEPVSLYIYDLSNGLAAMWGQALTGRPVEGIWHTSLVLYGMEVFFGQGISIVSPPGTTHHGVPKKKLPCGVTHLDKETFLEYIEGLRETYTADAYHLLEFNCNTFTNDVLSFLNSSSIPSYILSQPSEIMSTPFGAQMRPMIEQMFVGRRTATAGRAEIGRLTSQLGGLPTPAPTPPQPQDPSAESVASNLQIVTSAASLRSILDTSPSVVALYTHPSSSSSSSALNLKKTFESLARKYGRTKFVLVETHLAHGGAGEFMDLGLKEEDWEGETLALFSRDRCVKSLPSPASDALEDKIKRLEDRLWPTHPHAALNLSFLDALVTRARSGDGLVVWMAVPKKEGLERKLVEEVVGAAFGEGKEGMREEVREVLRAAVERVFEAAQGGKGVKLDESVWTAAIETVEVLSKTDNLDAPLFPLIDLLRLAFSIPLSTISATTLISLPRFLINLARTPETRSSAPSSETDLLTTLKLFSNLLSPALQPQALIARILAPDCLPSLTHLTLHALLSPSSSSTSKLPLVAAQTALSLVVRVCEERTWEEDVGGEEWEVEVASAVVEALGGAGEETGEILHYLAATLGTLLFRSPHFASIQSLLEVLETDDVLARVEERLTGADRKETKELVREVRNLVKSGGEA
ncbi:thioredoxin [Rhodotorula toruloides]|uniref:Thioredoxin n=1 Tax=Rhodotorula toruloides TaxID=5286 RepID=A0A511KCT0_RHOTO|nr:thioredoxin [Rhodotorula toruloides]